MKGRKLLILFIFATVSSQALGQQAPRRRSGPAVFAAAKAAQTNKAGVRQGKVDLLVKLQKVLSLTEAQVVAIKALETPHNENLQGLRAAAKEASETTKAAIDQGASATDVGNAVLAAHAIRQTIKTAQEQHKRSFNNVLTTDQQGRLARMNRMVRRARGLERYLALALPRNRE